MASERRKRQVFVAFAPDKTYIVRGMAPPVQGEVARQEISRKFMADLLRQHRANRRRESQR